MKGTLPTAGSFLPRRQITVGADSSPEEILRQADVNNSLVRGWNSWRRARQRQERLPEEGVAREVGKLLEREPAK